MSRRTNKSINFDLSYLRDELRSGTIRIIRGKDSFKDVVGTTLGSGSFIGFTTLNFNPQTLKRFETLFEVPNLGDATSGDKWPSQDQYATALQNFMNRRKDPWSHVWKTVSAPLEPVQPFHA